MACEYFVNGNWVTENQLKELLQGGLLDTLISDGTLAIKGFKVDPNKVIRTETVVTKRKSIPANKLANILAQEIKTRQGYSPNMLSALELKEDGSDFKIPLWASPYASKFESLLTSLVSNKVVKQKFPGGSYVLGSEEGFRIKEGDAAAGELKNSGIVFTEKFDPEKGLQPMRWDPETKKILPAQIMLPFKFRDENGNILPLKDFMVEGEDGRMILDTSKIPAKLLNLFGFRIPTQERNSMAAVEIVGFLPETSGDLILAPRDFTKQMGSDFDVDKLYTYMYNYFYKDGKLQTGFMSDKKKIAASLKIQKDHLEDIKNELKLSKADRKLIDNYIEERLELNENGDEVVSETATKASELISEILSKESNKELGKALDDTFNTISILKRSYKAVRQNNILDIHLQIMTSSNPEIIASIIALDSFGEFEQLAIDVDNDRNGNKKMPNILSETYQRTKFINATAGKNGVGSFSLDSTFNSTAQGKDIIIQNLTEEAREQLFGTVLNPKPRPTSAEVLAANTPLATFGNVISKGDISNKYTLRSQEVIKKAKLEKRKLTPKETQSLKYKSSIIRALQSTAVDNEKAQILDKLNINDETFDVIRALSLLGFEEQEIVGLITQEIIWEYVEKIRNSNSSLTPYNPNAAEDIFAELALKYDPSGAFAALDESRIELLSSKSAEDLMDNIKNKKLMRLQAGTTPDFNLEQLALLRKFQNLTATGKTIKVLQSTINTESSGIPKSLLETQGKIEQIERLPFLNVFNAEKLLGKYEEGKLSTPTTINGYAALYGAVFADEIFDKYFPYKSNGFKLAVDEIIEHMPRRSELSTTKKAELQSEIFDAVKSYLYANSKTNLFGENPDVERRRLFIDSKATATKPKNDSLATILQTLSEGANSKSWYQKNGFLNKLSFSLNKNGTISRINFEAAAGENFDETNIYDGFSYLLSKNFAVGNFNGIDYTSRMLAQELVAAAFLEGGTQGAKQYLKYVPVAYLKSLGFGEYLQAVPFDFQATFFGNIGENGLIYNRPSNFTRQYFQNNPEVTKTVRLSDLKGNIVATPGERFTLNEDALSNNFVDSTNPLTGDATKEQTQFLSIYDSKLPTKYALYEFDSVERIYRRIPVLNGSFDFVSYNSESKNSLPIEAKEIITTPIPQQTAPGYSIPNIPTQPSKEFNVDVVNNTALPRTTADLPIDKTLANSKEALDDLLNILETADEVSTLNRQLLQLIRGLELPKNFKVTYNKTEGRGSYDSAKDKETLNINLSHTKNQAINDLATVTAHELIHALTSASIRAYQDGNIEGLSARTIAAIQQLENLQKLYIDQLVAKEGEEGLKKFRELYSNWKQGKTSVPAFSKEDISKYYGAIKLTEFVTMALTDVGFQEHLNSITDESGVSLWEQLKELIANLLNTLGLDIKPGSALASTVKDTMDLIQANQETIRENNIETREFLEFGTTYKFQVDGNGKVVKGEYKQVGKMFEKLNAKTQQAKYDSLKAGVETWKLFGDKPGQPIQAQATSGANKINFEENQTGGYPARTKINASADATIHLADNFETPGEKLTKKSVVEQDKIYIKLTTTDQNLSKFNKEKMSTSINSAVDILNKFNAKTLNIAGNGIYDMKGRTQEEVDEFMYIILSGIVNSPNLKNKITLIRSGGQTGFDEAGAKAGIRLGIPTTVLAPKDWEFRTNEGNVKNEQAFKARFNTTQPSTSVKEGVSELFKSNPELASIGSQEQYSQYLSTIFPNSKVKDIVYRGGEKTDTKLFQYFTKNPSEAYMYSKANITKGGNITERNPIPSIYNQAKEYLDNKYGQGNAEILLSEDDFAAVINESLNPDYLDLDYNLTQKGQEYYNELQKINNKKKELLKTIDKKDAQLLNSITTVTKLYDAVKIESENDLTKPYDDINYQDNIEDYNKARKYIDDVLGVANIRKDIGKVTANIINITNPYKDEIAQEDLTNDRDAYKNEHDGAFLMGGDHFLVKSNTNQTQELGSKEDIDGFKNFVSTQPSTQLPTSVKVVSEDYGVVQAETNPSEATKQEFLNLIKPQIQTQTYKENVGKGANQMFHFGKMWSRVTAKAKPIKINSFAPTGARDRLIDSGVNAKGNSMGISEYTYAYHELDQNGNPLPSLSTLQPIINEIQNALGIDMSDYDSVIGNIYQPNEFIYPHKDVTESKSAEGYPVIVYTMGANAGLGIVDNNKGKMTFANQYDAKYLRGDEALKGYTNEVNTKAGTIYTFGLEGNGRFQLTHSTPINDAKVGSQLPITLPDGKVITNYTITLTFRRAADLTLGMPATPAKITAQPTTKTSAEKTEDKLNLEIENINKKYEIFPGVFANAGQTEALDKMTDFLASEDKAFLLKGRGGTGKTTIVKMVIDKSNIPHSQILGATIADEARGILANNLPTTVKTKTIASALGLLPDFNYKTGELYFRERNAQEQREFDARGKSDPIENAKLIIIDEASMVGDDIYEILMRKKRPNAKVIFMGDNAQIPPIMADGGSKDSPVFELLEGTENFSELTQRMRQGEESPILPVTDVYAENIESMQRGDQGKENPLTKRTSSFDLNSNSGVIFTDNRQEIVDSFVEDFQKDPDNLKNAVIIGARNEVVDNFAQLVRSKLFDNPSEPFVIGDIIRVNSPFLEGKEVIYANGFKGKVIKVEPLGINPLINLETFAITVEYDSVDISGKTVRKTTRMTTINPENKKALKSMLQALAVKAKSKQIPWQVYYNIKESIVDLGYNYAMTSHKVQGSTYKNVYVLEDDIMSFPGGRLQRNRMLYTAVSRPTTKLVLFSTKNTSAAVQKSTGLDLSKLSGNIENYQSMPTSSYGEENDRMKNRPSDDDWEAYNRARSTDELLPDSAINSEEFRNYLLICGK